VGKGNASAQASRQTAKIEMKTTAQKRKDCWRCDRCGKQTETITFFESVWNGADAVMFLRGRLAFYHVDGTKGGHAGAPSSLVAYGQRNVEALQHSGLDGALVTTWWKTTTEVNGKGRVRS
jgi:hypothetical protein